MSENQHTPSKRYLCTKKLPVSNNFFTYSALLNSLKHLHAQGKGGRHESTYRQERDPKSKGKRQPGLAAKPQRLFEHLSSAQGNADMQPPRSTYKGPQISLCIPNRASGYMLNCFSSRQ